MDWSPARSASLPSPIRQPTKRQAQGKSPLTQVLLGAITIVFCYIAEGIFDEKATTLSSIALIIFALYCLFSLITDQLVVVLCFPLFASLGPIILSNAYIEHGAYISEQDVLGEPTGATVRLAILLVLFLTAVMSVARLCINLVHVSCHSATALEWFRHIAFAVAIAAIFASDAVLMIYGSPMLTGTPRFDYWAQLPAIMSRLPYLLSISAALLLACISLRACENKRHAIFLLLACIATLLLFGEKFTGLFTTFSLGIITLFAPAIYLFGRRLRLLQGLLFLLLAAFIFMSIATVGYVLLHGYSLEGAVGKMIDRAFGLQGHVWYGVDSILQQTTRPPADPKLLSPLGNVHRAGMVEIMYAISPDDFVTRKLQGGTYFTMAGQALPAIALGYTGAAILQVAGGIATGLVYGYLFRSLICAKPLSLIIALTLIRQLNTAFIYGDPASLLKPLTLLCVLWALGDLLIWPKEDGDRPRAFLTSSLMHPTRVYNPCRN